MQRLIDANAVKENHKRWTGYLDDDMIGRMNFAIDHHVPTVLTIPDNPTNGDVVKAIFPDTRITEYLDLVQVEIIAKGFNLVDCECDINWWNAPFKRGTDDGTEVN